VLDTETQKTYRRQLRFQHEADPDWGRRVTALPGCESLLTCIQCGTCSAACPLSVYMDYTPRRTIAMVREGFRDDVLRSQTIWLCASCYACQVQCPREINITDVMYALKREAIREKKYPSRFPIPMLARAFFDIVKRRGRSSEMWIVLIMALRSNPLILLGMVKTGWHMLRTGRLSLGLDKIRGADELQKALASPHREV
jgi:quinone-modifying oxidoreductase, subunit QmoC